jgi:hypothetical protein
MYTLKNVEDLIFRQITEYATLSKIYRYEADMSDSVVSSILSLSGFFLFLF